VDTDVNGQLANVNRDSFKLSTQKNNVNRTQNALTILANVFAHETQSAFVAGAIHPHAKRNSLRDIVLRKQPHNEAMQTDRRTAGRRSAALSGEVE